MAALSESELTRTVRLMAEHYGLDRLRDRFANLGAFKSRRGVNTPEQLADRLYRLSGGLRRQTIPTYAFSSLWAEMLKTKVGEEGEKQLEELADKVNACLGPDELVLEGKESEIDQALGAYREALAGIAGAEVAEADMLLKSVPAVASRLRSSASAAEG